MHPEDIKAAMRKRGVKPSELARHLGVSSASVTSTLRGRTRSRRIADAVAKIVGLPVDTLWPGAYVPAPASDRVARILGPRARGRRTQ